MVQNPGKIKRANPDLIVARQALALAVPLGEHDLAALLNDALRELKLDGTLPALLKRYGLDSAEL